MYRLFFALIVSAFLTSQTWCGEKEAPAFVQWAWNAPAEDVEKYPLTDHYFWNPPKDFFGAGFRYLRLRDRESADEDNIGFGGNFRPFLFNLGGDMSLTVGAYGVYSHDWTDASQIPALSVAGQYEVEGEQFGTGLSLMLSVPSAGIQCFLEIGHYWNRGQLDTNSYQDPDLQFFGYEYAKVRQLQKERGLEYWFEISYLVDRLYLYGVTLDFYGSAPTGPREANVRLYIPEAVQPFIGASYLQDSIKPVESGFFLSLAYIRAFAVEVFPKGRITVEPVGGAGYFRESHGHTLIAGVRLNLFDFAGISWYYIWQRNNDVPDAQALNFELGFRFGRKFGARPQ
jgi:hypothetical protein